MGAPLVASVEKSQLSPENAIVPAMANTTAVRSSDPATRRQSPSNRSIISVALRFNVRVLTNHKAKGR